MSTNLSKIIFYRHKISSVQSLNHFLRFATRWTAACQASLSITTSQNLLKLMSLSRWCRWWEVEHQSVNFEWKPGTELIILQTHIVATVYSLSHVQLCCDPRDCSPLGSSVRELPRPEYWSGLSWPMPGDFPNQRWTHISCIGRCILHHWAARKAHKLVSGK